MLSTAIGIQFDVNDLNANYEVVGSSNNYSFQYNLGKGSKLVDFEGETAQKTISLNGNYGIFSIRIFAVSDVGIRSEFIEKNISISPPLFDDTFTFSEIRVSNLPQDSNIGSTIEIEPSETGNLLAVNSEYINRNVEIEWRLSPPPGHAKEGKSLGNELLSDKLLSNFSLQIRNTENGNVISDNQLNNSIALQSTLNTASVSDMMDAYTGFSFTVSNDTITELSLDRTLALEVVSNDAFGRQATGILTGINYLPTVDSLSYNLKGAKMSFGWAGQDTDFRSAQISSLAIPGDEEIHDPYNLQNSIDYYESLSRASPWEKHSNYRVGDKVFYDGVVFKCIQNYIYSNFPNINTSDASYWENMGPAIDHHLTQQNVTQNSAEFDQTWGYNYFYSFIPVDGYGTGLRANLTESGLFAGGILNAFKSDVKIDNLNFIERGADLIFRWNVTDQDNNLVDLNQYKFLVGSTDKPSVLGVSGSLYDSDTNLFLTGITDGLNSRTSVTTDGVEVILEDLPGTKVFETYEYTREINNSIYKAGGFPAHEDFSFSGQYNNGDHVIFDNSLYAATTETSSNSAKLTTPSIDYWAPDINYLFRSGLHCSDLFIFDNNVYSVTGSVDNEIIGPDASDVLGIYNELESYSVGDLVISPVGNAAIYKGGKLFDVGDRVLYKGSLYQCLAQQQASDYISPDTGIHHWRTAGAFSDFSSNVYKAINAVPQLSEILPSTGITHWATQNPETSDKYFLFAEHYDFPVVNWSQFDDFSSLDFVVYANDIWSGIDSSGPNTPAGAKAPNLSNGSYWANTDNQSSDFSTSHQIGDKVFSNGAIYKCLANNPTGAPLEAVVDSASQINSSYQSSQWIPYWELNTGFDDTIFKHEGIPESGKRSVGLELGILSPLGEILNSRKIVGNNPEPSISPNNFQVRSLENATQVHFNFNYANNSRERTTKLQLYRSSDPVFSILDANGFPGSGAGSFVSEIFGPADSTFGKNINKVTDSPPIPGNETTGYYYKLLPFDAFGSGDLFNVKDNQGGLDLILAYPHGHNNQNKNGYMGPVFSTTEDAIPGPVRDFKGDTAFKNYFLNWKMPDAEFDTINNIINTSPNDISHYEVWESEDNYLYFGTEDTTLNETRNLSGYRRITGDLVSVGPIPTEIDDPALGITNATNVLNISAISPSVQVTHQGEPNDKRYFWVRPVDHAGNKGPFTGDADLGSSSDVIGLDLILGQASTTDVSDFEQNITKTFPNTLALVPNNPFTANQPYGGEVAWDRHFVYSDGVGYVIGHSDTHELKTSQGLSTAKYIYWKRSDMSSLSTEQYSILGLAPPGDKVVRLIDAEIDGGQNITNKQFSIKETNYDLGSNNQYNNHYIRFKNGLLDTQERKISNYQKFANYATITLDRSLSLSPLNGDDIEILEEVSVSSAITNPLRSIQFSGQYRVSNYHPAGEGETNNPSGYAGPDMDLEKPSLLDDNDFIIARNAGGTPTPMWHAFANATIGTAHIEEAAITNAKIHNLTADKIRSSVIQSQDIQVGGDANSGQIRSAGFGLLNNSGTRGYDCVDAPGAGFAISGNGSFIFKTERGKLFFEDDELTIHGNIRQKDGSELTVMSMNAEPAVFNYDETADGVFDPELLQTSNITVRFNNSDITASGVRFKMELPDGTNIFNYTDYSNGYNAYGFEYQPSNTYFNSDTKVATATFKVGDRKTNAAGFDKIIHGTDDVIDFQSVIIYASGIGTSTEHSTTVSMLANGAAGPTGKTPVYRGVWSASANYIGMEDGNQGSDTAEELRGDLVYYDNSSSPAGANGHHYIAMKNSGPSSLVVAPGTHAQTDDYWKKFGAEFQSVATNLLLADNAVITHSLTMGSSDDDNPATHGAGGKIVSSQFLGGFNDDLTANRSFVISETENYSNAGFRLQKSATSPYNVALDVGGSNSYFRYSSIDDKVEIKGSFINNTVAENISGGAITATDSQATFIGGGYNNEIHEDPNNAYNSLGSSIVGGAHNNITGRFSFIGNGYNNSVGDNFSAIVAGYNNSMPDVDINNEGANIIGAGVDNKIDGGSAQCILAGDKNIISYDETDTTYLTNKGLIDFEFSYLNKNILGDGVNTVALIHNNSWAISSSWFPARKAGTTLTNWDSAFYVKALVSSGNKPSDGQGWIYDANFGWVYLGGPGGGHNLYLSTQANPAKAMFAWAPDLTGVGASSWKLFFESQIWTNYGWFKSAFISNPTLIGTWQDGEGIIVYEENSSPPWFGLIRNSSGVIFSSPIPNPYVNPLTYSDASPPITPIVGDIDADGTPDASDSTPAIRLRGTRQSNGSIVWFVYVIFTNTSLTNAKIHVSGGAAFAGSLQDSDTLSSQNSYKVGDFTANNISSLVNGYTNYAYFRFPVSSDNGSTYSNSQTIESIEVAIPTVGASSGDEASTYKHLYQSL